MGAKMQEKILLPSDLIVLDGYFYLISAQFQADFASVLDAGSFIRCRFFY